MRRRRSQRDPTSAFRVTIAAGLVIAAFIGGLVADRLLLPSATMPSADLTPVMNSHARAAPQVREEKQPEAPQTEAKPAERSIMVCGVASAPVWREPRDRAEQVTQALFGHTLEIKESRAEWLHVRVVEQDYTGWLRASAVAEVQETKLGRGIVNSRGAAPAVIAGELTPDGWPDDLPAGSVVMMNGAVASGRVEAVAPSGSRAWLPADHIGPSSVGAGGSHAGERIAEAACSFLGSRYEWGGLTTAGVDCSGLVWVSHFVCGISLPRDAAPQSGSGVSVSNDAIEPGDCVFFGSNGSVTHVGIYVGNHQFIHATPPRVIISSLHEVPHAKRLICVRRMWKPRRD